jgi:hypothetical protein
VVLSRGEELHDRTFKAHALAVASHVSMVLLTTGFRPPATVLVSLIAAFAADDPPGQFYDAVESIIQTTLAMADNIEQLRTASEKN